MSHPYRPDPTSPVPWSAPALLEHLAWWCKRSTAALWRSLIVGLFALQALMLATASCNGSGLQVQARTADAVADSANAALPILIQRYREQGFRELQQLKEQGATKAEARSAVERIEDEWRPIWNAWESLSIAQAGWAAAIESGDDVTAALVELRTAYCELRAVWPSDLPAIPLAPVNCAR